MRIVLDVSGVNGADTSGGFGSVYYSETGPAARTDIQIADLEFRAAHKQGEGLPTLLDGAFYVNKK